MGKNMGNRGGLGWERVGISRLNYVRLCPDFSNNRMDTDFQALIVSSKMSG